MKKNAEDRSEIGAGTDPLVLLAEYLKVYKLTGFGADTKKAETIRALRSLSPADVLAQATANAELRAEVARLRSEAEALRAAQVDRPILTWMAGTDSGSSSESLASCHLGLTPRWGWMEPADSSDFGRCYRLLLGFPEIRPCVDKLAEQHSGWAKLAPIWDELMQMAKEDGLERRGKYSERIHARIRATRWPALAAAEEVRS
jgi:hypothetical protein